MNKLGLSTTALGRLGQALGPDLAQVRAPPSTWTHFDDDLREGGRAPPQHVLGMLGHGRGGLDPCHLPRHDGGGLDYGGGNLNSKAELPDLPATATPLQFGDWIHLCTPVLKDISSVSARWWECTWREAGGFYRDWQQSTPLGRIQIQPRLPEELCEV